MTPKDYLTNKFFCPIPWTGLMYNFDGSVKNCIRSSDKIGNIHNDSIEEILNNTENIRTRQDMIQGNPGQRCSPCYELETGQNSFDIISDRVFYLRELKSIPINLYKDPNAFDLHKVDIRWSNLCNFACIYCGPEFSSKWASELKISPNIPSDQKINKFKNYIFDKVSQLKHVYLAGGEPLLMKENLEFLQLLKAKNSNVNLRINTNLSKVDTNIFDLICSFKNVHWTLSVETIEEEFEYIRYGGKWTEFLDNLNTIRKYKHKVSFNMLHFLLNYNSIFRCIDFFKDLGFHNNSFIIGALLQPDFLNIRHLPNDVLNLVKQQLLNRINENCGYLLENGYRNMLQYIDQPIQKNLSNSLYKLKQLDERRGLDSTKIFKELYNYGNQTF